MTRHLLLSVRFLDDRYHGLSDNGERPEWPPSPFRLFQALVAGNARGREIPEPVAAALRWLETLPPPHVIAPEKRNGRVLLTYVLNNVTDTDPNSRAAKTIRPTLLNGDRLVQYCWTFDASRTEAVMHAGAVIAAARHVRSLGWGIDLAIGHGEITDRPPEVTGRRTRYRPSPSASVGGVDLRAPRPGSFKSLCDTYGDFLSRYESSGVTRLESAAALYEPTRYVVGAGRPYAAFRIVDEEGDFVGIPQQLIAPLVGMVRDLGNRAHVIAEIGQEVIDRDFKGHAQGVSPARVSILPLPTIRTGPTDGLIRRLLLAQPAGSDGTLCATLALLLDGQRLRPVDGEERFSRAIHPQHVSCNDGRRGIQQRPRRDRAIHLQHVSRNDAILPLYTGTSCVWASVTPVLLPGYDDRKQHRGDHVKRLGRAEQLFRKAIEQSSLPQPTQVELSRVPFFTGSLHARAYAPREKLSHYPRYHVRMEFDRPVSAPLAIGAGRHVGFGLLAACEKEQTSCPPTSRSPATTR